MDKALSAWSERWLGSAVAEVLFEAGTLSAVAGVRLADGCEVVIKVRPPAPQLRPAYLVQRHAWQRGYPAPWTPDDIEAFWAASLWTLAVDAKEAVTGGSVPDLSEAEALERLALAGA